MKTLTTIFAAAVLLFTSCGQNNESSSTSQVLLSNDNDGICQLIAKNNTRKQKLITGSGIRIMELKINRN